MENSKIRRNYLTKKDIKLIGGLIAEDEVFRPVEGESALWISNYARILSKRKKNPRILKTIFQKGYHRIKLPQKMYGKAIAPTYYVHVLVARAFCEIADWIKQSDAIEVHHIKKINRDCEIKGMDYAENLMWIPRKIHKAVDQIKTIQIYRNGKWREYDFVTAAVMFGVTPYEFIEAIQINEPTKVEDNYNYYDMMVNSDGRSVYINCKIKKNQYK